MKFGTGLAKTYRIVLRMGVQKEFALKNLLGDKCRPDILTKKMKKNSRQCLLINLKPEIFLHKGRV